LPTLSIWIPTISLRQLAGGALLAALALAVAGSQPAAPPTPPEPEPVCVPETEWDRRCAWFDAFLELASLADAELELEPDWSTARSAYGDDLELLTWIIAPRLVDEGVADRARTSPVSWHDFAGESGVVGRYYINLDRIQLSLRYLRDPAWSSSSYLSTLTHELVHAHGYRNEMVAEAITLETLAHLGNLGEPGFRRAALDLLRRKALLAAYHIAAFGAHMDPGVHPTTGCRRYVPGECVEPVPNEAMLARWRAVRRQVYTSAELRHADARLRWWLRNDTLLLLEKYVSRPMSIALATACAAGQAKHDVPREGAPEEGTTRTIYFDDTAYLLAELGWRCLDGNTPDPGP
jgi:hypothetical protein